MLSLSRPSVALSLSLLLASVLFAYPSLMLGIPRVEAANHSLFLDGRLSAWNSTTTPNPSITVVSGDTVTMSLSSGDGFPHLFYIDLNGDASNDCPQEKCSAEFPPDTSLSFAVDFVPDTYRYYCRYHQETMQGSFVVQGFTIASIPSSLRVVQGSSNTSAITVTSVNGFSGVVDLSATASPSDLTAALNPPSVTLSSGGTETSILTVSTSGSTPLGSYVVTVEGTSGSAHSTRSIATMVVAPDFGISANPTMLEIPLGSAQSSTITLTSLNSFSGDIDLSTSSPPTGIAVSFSSNPVTLSSGGTAISFLDVAVSSGTVSGTYVLDVTGTSGALTHTSTITIVAGPDFGVVSNPVALTLAPGSSGTSTITLTSFNSFTGTVDLTGSVSPVGPSFSFSPQTVLLTGGGSTTAILAVNASDTIAASTYTVTVTATSGSTIHSVPIIVSVVDFSITASNTSLILQQGSSITTTISLTSINGFVGDVNLTAATPTSVLLQLLNATTLSLNPSGPRFATLTLSAASAPTGTYTISITGTSGSRTRSVSVSITVQPSDGGAGVLTLTVGGIAGAIAIAVAGTYFMRRRKQPREHTDKLDSDKAS